MAHTKMMDQSNEYRFEWDESKAASNLRKHKVSFEQAATLFKDKLAMTVYDEAHSLTEERWFTLGMDNIGRLLAISHTFQEITSNISRIRIISARLATKQGKIIMKTIKSNEIQEDEIPSEIDFSKGKRGKFYRPDLKLKLPVYLEDTLQQRLLDIARQRNLSFSDMVNDLINKELAIKGL